MKKLLAFMCVLAMAFAFTACSKPAEDDNSDDGKKVTKIALLLPYIGDQSYFDVVYNGLKEVAKLENVETKLIEMGVDNSKWANYYLEACEGGYDLIIGGNWEAEPALYKAAKDFPEQKFINFDYSAPEKLPNVYAVAYKTEELGFGAGLVAAVKSTTGVIGGVGGMDMPGINDFMAGYIQGAKAINPDIKVSIGYVGNFSDPAKAKEQAENIYKSGADIIFHAAGGAGNGVFEAAVAQAKLAIGVDADQTLTFSEKPEIANVILTSATKNCDKAIVRAVNMFIDGTLQFGTNEELGIKEDGVGLARNKQFETLLTAEQIAQIDTLLKDVVDGKIAIEAVRNEATTEKWDAIKKSVAR